MPMLRCTEISWSAASTGSRERLQDPAGHGDRVLAHAAACPAP